MRRVFVFSVALVVVILSACAPKTSTLPAPPPPPPTAGPTGGPGPGRPIAFAAAPAALEGTAFEPGCDVPFGSIGAVRDIDNNCGPAGEGSASSQLQNRAKNNFCAGGPAIDINRQVLRRLQQNVDGFQNFPWGSPTNIPSDRSRLKSVTTVDGQSIGEGTRVRVRAYFMHANYSNTSSGENVNCGRTGQANNDIHIYLGMTAEEDDRCESLNAEITPHFRPAKWLSIVGLDISPKRPLRITGQLFFDASHQPCRPDKRHNPNRFTSWEIHPVYDIEVCKFKSASSCPLTSTTVWIPFDEWLGEDEHDDGF